MLNRFIIIFGNHGRDPFPPTKFHLWIQYTSMSNPKTSKRLGIFVANELRGT